MRYHCGAAHSCSSIADMVLKNSQRFKEKLALNRWVFFMTRSAKLEQLRARAAMITHSFIIILIYYTPLITPQYFPVGGRHGEVVAGV